MRKTEFPNLSHHIFFAFCVIQGAVATPGGPPGVGERPGVPELAVGGAGVGRRQPREELLLWRLHDPVAAAGDGLPGAGLLQERLRLQRVRRRVQVRHQRSRSVLLLATLRWKGGGVAQVGNWHRCDH